MRGTEKKNHVEKNLAVIVRWVYRGIWWVCAWTAISMIFAGEPFSGLLAATLIPVMGGLFAMAAMTMGGDVIGELEAEDPDWFFVGIFGGIGAALAILAVLTTIMLVAGAFVGWE